MSRRDFYPVDNVPVLELLLDVKNARIRSAQDQSECISRILKKEEQLLNLAKDIVEQGLSTVPILVWKNPTGKWVVMDGNRRITALKLLNNPDLAPEERIRKQYQVLKTKNIGNIPSTIDCLASDSEDAIVKEILLRHSGALAGAGQLDWTTYWRTTFMLQHNQSDPNRRVGQYLLWAEERNIPIEDSFPVTNLVRFINEANLKLLGFKVEKDKLVEILNAELCKKMAIKIITDFGINGKTVNSVFTPEQQETYINEVRTSAGLSHSKQEEGSQEKETDGATSPGNTNGRTSSGGENTDRNTESGSSQDQNADNKSDGKPATDGSSRGTRPKASWDRPKLFPKGIFPGSIPPSETKALSVVHDLCRLKTEETTVAVAVMLRVLIEMSDAYYRSKNGLAESNSLKGSVSQSAQKMLTDGKLTKDQFDVIERRAGTVNDMLNIKTLQSFVHTSTFHPDKQSLHTFWDDARWFVVECWKS